MKRNWDIIREILLATEDIDSKKCLTLNDFDAARALDISYHVELLEEAGMIYADLSDMCRGEATQFFVIRLTWDGHEFLDTIRAKSTWDKTKDLISTKGSIMTFDIIKGLGVQIGKAALDL
jgi:hypothetical protein